MFHNDEFILLTTINRSITVQISLSKSLIHSIIQTTLIDCQWLLPWYSPDKLTEEWRCRKVRK